MKKREWLESYEEEQNRYDKSILSHDDEKTDSMKDYEFSLNSREDDDYYKDLYDSPAIGGFSDY
jgi:hypothetical protein